MTATWERRAREFFSGNPARRIQSLTGAGAIAVAVLLFRNTSVDRALCWSITVFGSYTLARVAFNAFVASVSDPGLRRSDVLADQLVAANQTAILGLTGTTLGILTAFTTGVLPVTTRAAVVSLVAAALVQFSVQASGARRLGPHAWTIGLVGDFVAHCLFSFGLFCLAASLLTRTGA